MQSSFLNGICPPIAHRGLHGAGAVENSRAAFRAAIAAGHGIECDVQISRDGEAFIFHDYDLDRLTGESGKVAERDAADLERILLSGTGETLPRLAEMLGIVGGCVPLLIEIKAQTHAVARLCRAVRRALASYQGPVAVMSFNPEVGHWFRRHAPGVPRGLVMTEEGRRGRRGDAMRHLSFWRARAQFLAYDIRDLPSRFAASRQARGLPLLTWTVRSPEQQALARANGARIIYEGFDPAASAHG